jgi:hypothetical protein
LEEAVRTGSRDSFRRAIELARRHGYL